MAEYTLVEGEEDWTGFRVTLLETRCVGACPHLYRIDSTHQSYNSVKTALDRGDRSVVFCYHDVGKYRR